MTGIPSINWNGVPKGYHLYFAKLSSLTPEQRLKLVAEDYPLYTKMLADNTSANLLRVDGLEVFTSYVFFICGFTDAGMGPSARVECTTNEGGNIQLC